MKRITILLTVALIAIISLKAQNPDRPATQKDVKEYLITNIYPEIQKQQDIYMNNLSDDEKEVVLELRDERPARNSRGNMQQGTCILQVEKITDNYPDLNKAYADFVNDNKDQWINDIDSIHKKNNIDPVKNKDGFTGYGEFIKRVSEPEFLLLWNSEKSIINRIPPRDGRGQGFGQGGFRTDRMDRPCGRQGNPNRQVFCMSDRPGRFNPDPEIMTQVDEYVQANVIPVISSERISFDKNLSKKEKQTIADTRAKIVERKAEMNKWRESEDFEPGRRAQYPAFDEQRKEMRDQMDKVRDIAMVHRDEIYASLENIRKNNDTWEEGISEIIGEDRPGKPCRNMDKGGDKIYKMNPVAFLIFDPENPVLQNAKMMNNKPCGNRIKCR